MNMSHGRLLDSDDLKDIAERALQAEAEGGPLQRRAREDSEGQLQFDPMDSDWGQGLDQAPHDWDHDLASEFACVLS